MRKRTHRIGLLFSLYFCQGLPGGFLALALPVILRQSGQSLTMVGLSSLLSLPWVLKLLWAPLVDRYGWPGFGRRKSWIVPAQLGMLLVTLVFASFEPEQNLLAVAALFLVLNLLAATQDIGVDGLAVDILAAKDLGPGNAAQVSGFKLGNLFGGGVLLALSAVIGWRGDFLIMSLVLSVSLLFLLASDENTMARPRARQISHGERPPVLATLLRTLRHQGLGFWLFLAYAKFGETFGGAMLKPLLVDRGFSRSLIGLLDGTFGALATILGALAGGLLCRMRGPKPALAVASALQGVCLIALAFYTRSQITPFGVGFLNAWENAAGGAVGVAIFALAMGLCRPEVGASQFTASQVVYMAGAFAAYPLAGRAAEQLGYLPVMLAGGLMALLLAALAASGRPRTSVP